MFGTPQGVLRQVESVVGHHREPGVAAGLLWLNMAHALAARHCCEALAGSAGSGQCHAAWLGRSVPGDEFWDAVSAVELTGRAHGSCGVMGRSCSRERVSDSPEGVRSVVGTYRIPKICSKRAAVGAEPR